MIKDTAEKNATLNASSMKMEILKEHFPACFKTDGNFDIERFKEYLNDKITVTNEGYELRFLGKNYARLLASLDTTTVITPDEEHNTKPENINSQNIYISGDNLDGIKHLLKSYAGRIKCIYIDPPYNTGTDGFVYNDSFNFTPEELNEKLGLNDIDQATHILKFTKRSSASHSAWLMFMYPRLLLARDLLSRDGVIFISIDDNEQANCRLLCDDIFGEENFVSNLIIQSNKRGQTYKQIAKTHEYLFVITRDSNAILNELDKAEGTFDKHDSIGEFEERELRNRNPKYGKFNRPNLFYPIYTNPNVVDNCGYSPVSLTKSAEFCIEILPLNSEGDESCWRWGMKKFQNNCSEDSMESEVVARKKSTGEYGCYEKYRKTTYKAKSIWYEENIVGDLADELDDIWEETNVITEQGSKELGQYGMGEVFDFPKPVYLIEKALNIGSDKDSLCLDFFSGSGTAMEAVMRLNARDKGNRRLIAIQLYEDLDEKLRKASKSEKVKVQKKIDFLDKLNYPHTLDWIGIERIKRAAKKIKEENPDTTVDFGFKHYTLKEPSADTLDKLEKFDPNQLMVAENLLDEFGLPTVLTTWIVRDGYGFASDVQELDFAGYKGYWQDKHLYLIAKDITQEAILALIDKYEMDGEFNPENVVIFGYSFTWTATEELKINLMRLKDSKKNRYINFEVRY